MAGDDFWELIRRLRASLVDGGEDRRAAALWAALAPNAVRGGLSDDLVAWLEDLRTSEVAVRLALTGQIDALLAAARGQQS